MREIIVSKKCMGCGQCVMESKYLEETPEGNAKFISGGDVSDNDVDAVNKVIASCPVQALSLKEISATSQRGTAAIKEIIDKLSADINSVNIPKITERDIPFKEEDYYLSAPYSSKEYNACYKSESQARSAARDEFERLLYRESAFRPMIKKIFVEYKTKVLKPYYTYENTEKSYYYKFNEQYAKKLGMYYSDVVKAVGNPKVLPESWKEFNVFPATGKGSERDECDPVRFFDLRSTSSGIMAEMRSDQYTSLSYYVDQMDYDYNEEYVGEGFFGTKTRQNWYFSGFSAEADEFVKDLKSAMRLADPGIEGSGVSVVNDAIRMYEDKVKTTLRERLEALKKLL